MAEGIIEIVSLFDASEIIFKQRLIKSDAEVACLAEAGRQACEGYKKLLEYAVDGNPETMAAGAAEGAIDAASILKPMLARGELQTIGATTLDEYRKHIEKDAALERRFQPIQVDEPSVEDTVEILRGLRDRYETHHRVSITDDALHSAAVMADRYISDRFLPDKAVDLIDEAGARLRIQRMSTPPEIKEYDARIEKVRQEKEAAIDGQDFEGAASLRDKEQQLQDERNRKEREWREEAATGIAEVDEDMIAEVLSKSTGIPVFRLSETEAERLRNMEGELHRRLRQEPRIRTQERRAEGKGLGICC